MPHASYQLATTLCVAIALGVSQQLVSFGESDVASVSNSPVKIAIQKFDLSQVDIRDFGDLDK